LHAYLRVSFTRNLSKFDKEEIHFAVIILVSWGEIVNDRSTK